MRATRRSARALAAVCGAAAMVFCLIAGPAQAATKYPQGGGTFTGGAEGWEAIDASCNVPATCTASGGYDGSDGNPPGSIAANTNITIGLAGLFKSTVTLQ